ncbi:hypothetical protein M3Y99_01645400 [Aphelenchoides fujianensis]|nr:hypothetical protein M3Y99_01645400 [Aphelenchoides fujianensis]
MRSARRRCPAATLLLAVWRAVVVQHLLLMLDVLLPPHGADGRLASAALDGLPGFYFSPPLCPCSHSTTTPSRSSLPQLSLRHSHGNTIKNSCNTNINARHVHANQPRYSHTCTPVSLTLSIFNNNNANGNHADRPVPATHFAPNPFDPNSRPEPPPLQNGGRSATFAVPPPNYGNGGESIEENVLPAEIPPSFGIERSNTKHFSVNPPLGGRLGALPGSSGI